MEGTIRVPVAAGVEQQHCDPPDHDDHEHGDRDAHAVSTWSTRLTFSMSLDVFRSVSAILRMVEPDAVEVVGHKSTVTVDGCRSPQIDRPASFQYSSFSNRL